MNSWRSRTLAPCIPYVHGLVLCLCIASHLHAQPNQPAGEANLDSRPLFQSLQRSLDALSRAEIARERAQLTNRGAAELDAAREECRTAIAQLQTLNTQLAALLRETYQIRPSQRKENSWTIRELESLGRNLKVQLARGYRNQALCYDEDSVDRLNSLSLALEQLPEVTMQPLDDASVWRARIEQVVCLRLMKKTVEAQQLIEKWQGDSPPTNIASRFQGERIWIHLDSRDLERALEIVHTIQTNKEQTATSPETDDAILEALLAAQELASPQEASQLLQRAAEQLQRITQHHGPYWQRRAKVSLGQAMISQIDSDDTELLGYAAASLYASGEAQKAVTVYDRIATLHAAKDQTHHQLDAQATSAAILRELSQPQAALSRFRRLALQHSRHEKAAAMHLVAIGLSAELAREARVEKRTEAFEKYLALLKEHLKLWPDQASSAQVKQWLARTELPEIERQRAQTMANRGYREQALALYRKLVQNAPDDAKLLEEYAELLAAGLDQPELREALRLWQQIEKRSKPGGPRWWRGRRARLALLEQLGEGEQAEKLEQLTEILYPSEEAFIQR